MNKKIKWCIEEAIILQKQLKKLKIYSIISFVPDGWLKLDIQFDILTSEQLEEILKIALTYKLEIRKSEFGLKLIKAVEK